MGRLSSDDLRTASISDSGGGTGHAGSGAGSGAGAANTSIRSSRSSSERSPQKGDTNARAARAQELLVKLRREEKIRDAAGAMLADLNFGLGQQHKHHGNMIKQLNSLNSLKSDSQHKKKVKAQYEAAQQAVETIHDQLRELGFDEDDEVSSGDDEGPSGGPSMFLADDYEDDAKSTPFLGMLSPSAASSAVDLSNYEPSPPVEPHAGPIPGPGPVVGPQPAAGQNGGTLAPESAVHYIVVLLEALDPHSTEAPVAVDKISELIMTVSGVKLELKRQAPWRVAAGSIRPFLLDADPLILGLGLRLLRLLLVDSIVLRYFKTALHFELLLIQILAKDDHDKNHQLRLHATQLIRVIINIPNGVEELDQGTYRALVAVAEQSSDGIRHICVETLAELLVIEPSRVFEAGGVKVMLNAMNEAASGGNTTPNHNSNTKSSGATLTNNNNSAPPPGAPPPASNNSDGGTSDARDQNNTFALAVALAFIGAADDPELRRKYLREGRDLSTLLTHFTDAPLYGIYKVNKQQLRASTIVMQALLRSWVGLMCFDLDLFIRCMSIPIAEIQDALLCVLDNVLWIPPVSDHAYATSARSAELLSSQFTALLLNRLQRSGLQEQLVTVQTNGVAESVRKRAEYIGSKIFLLSSKLVPQHAVVSRSMVIPHDLSEKMAKGSKYSLPTESAALFGSESQLQQINAWDCQPHLETFIKLGVAMDDASFKRLLNMTHVLDTKMFRQWNWDALMILVKGPLRSLKRFEEVSRGSKFLKRLLSFYRPFKHRFSNLPITRDHLQYVEVGKELVLSLLESPEGARYVSQNKLFRQIAECLAQLDPRSGIMSKDPLFSVRRFRSTLCCAYSEFLCVLTRSVEGHRILAQIRVFNLFYRLCDINREDIVRSIICGMDYRLEGHPRIILAKCLTASSRATRLYATEFVGYKLASAEEPYLWAIDLMVEQLFDSEVGIVNAAAQGLHNMCSASGQALDYLISLNPFLGHIPEAAEPLKLLFMCRPQGFQMLIAELESKNMEQFIPEFNSAYVDKIESYLESVNFSTMRAGSGGGSGSGGIDEISCMVPTPANTTTTNKMTGEPFTFPSYARPQKKQHSGKIAPPPHPLGELALTEQGCRILKSKGAIASLAATIEEAVNTLNEKWSEDKLRNTKAALWAAGHIASRQNGAQILDMKLAASICTICRNAEVFSIRGTAYYALGLFALSLNGAELLHQNGWDVVYNTYCQPVGVTLPPSSYFEKTQDVLEFRRARLSLTKFPPNDSECSLAKSVDKSVDKSTDKSGGGGATEEDEDKMVTPTDEFPPYDMSRPNKPAAEDTRSIRSLSPGTRHDTTVSRSGPIRGGAPLISRAQRLRTPSVGETNGVTDGTAPPPLLAPSISFTSLSSPKTHASSNSFDFEMDPELSSRRSSCFDLIDSKRDDTLEQVYACIGQLGSYVLAQKASRALVALRSSHPEVFQDGSTLLKVVRILSLGHYKQVTRRFVFELFDLQQCLDKLYKRGPGGEVIDALTMH